MPDLNSNAVNNRLRATRSSRQVAVTVLADPEPSPQTCTVSKLRHISLGRQKTRDSVPLPQLNGGDEVNQFGGASNEGVPLQGPEYRLAS